MKLDEDTRIGDLLDYDPTIEQALLSMGLNCMGCPASRGGTIRDACDIHQLEPRELLEHLRRHLER